MAFFGASRPAAVAPEVKDIEVVDPPEDSISRVSFCPTADILAVASWNNEVSVLVAAVCSLLM
jgi:mRNA export factor